MCFVIIAMMFACIPFTKAKANPALVIPAAVVADAAEMLLIIGITVTTAAILYKVTEEFLKQNPVDLEWFNNVRLRNMQDPNDPNFNGKKIKFIPGDVEFIRRFYEDAKKFFKDKEGVVSVECDGYQYDGTNYIPYTTDVNVLFNKAPFRTGDSVKVVGVTTNYTYSAVAHGTGIKILYDGKPVLYYNDNVLHLDYGENIDTLSYQEYRWGFYSITATNGNQFLMPYIVGKETHKPAYYNGATWSALAIYNCVYQSGATCIIKGHSSPITIPYPYSNNPKYNPNTVVNHMISAISNNNGLEIDTRPITEIITKNDDTDITGIDQDDALDDAGIKDDIISDPTSLITPAPLPTPSTGDDYYKPDITTVPDVGGLWHYVTDFLKAALIWMQLWYSGFIMLPVALKTTLFALLVITIVIGLLGVFLK